MVTGPNDTATRRMTEARAYVQHRLRELDEHRRLHVSLAADCMERSPDLLEVAAKHLRQASMDQAVAWELTTVLEFVR